MFKKYFVFAYLLAHSVLLFGQTPTLVPIDHNPALRNREPKIQKSSTRVDTISLPPSGFFDDFSYYWRSSQPDTLWMDNYVYINNHYPIEPRSIGVATFDALDANGNVYKSSTSTFPADTLTSRPIDLNGLDNVWLSFFYQPQGYGDNPEPGDSLIVQFKTPVADKWRTVRSIPGNPQGTPVPPFKPMIIPVDGEYLYKGFQFRFVNLVSLEQNTFNPGRKSNADHWHIDYVYLNNNRNANDTTMRDVAMIAPIKSLIKGYQSIPWDQLEFAFASRFEPTVEMIYRNNHRSGQPDINRFFEITDVSDQNNHIITCSMSLGREDIEAGQTITFSRDIDIFYPFESTAVDSARFELKAYLRINQDDWRDNDTVRFVQVFKDYFARDDGSPENGYGFSGYNAQGCAVACRYETFKPDSVRAIQIYFNPTDNNVTTKYRFRIAVWRDDNGRPGEQIYLSPSEYSPDVASIGKFTQYNLRKPVYVTRNFWIGWVQVTTGFLNVGFDRNHNDRGNLWYNNGKWRQDINNGTLMIRPIMGKRKDFPTSAEQPATATNTRINIYPNPASQNIRITLETFEPVISSDYDTALYSVTGQLCYRAPLTNDYIDVSSFESGFYIVRVIHRKTGIMQSQKLIIIR